MRNTPTYRPCPACDGTDCAQLDAYPQGGWSIMRALKLTGEILVRVPSFASLNRRANDVTPTGLRAVAARAGLHMTITNSLTLPIDDNINALFSLKNQTQGAA